jgi:hypothetical protein
VSASHVLSDARVSEAQIVTFAKSAICRPEVANAAALAHRELPFAAAATVLKTFNFGSEGFFRRSIVEENYRFATSAAYRVCCLEYSLSARKNFGVTRCPS